MQASKKDSLADGATRLIIKLKQTTSKSTMIIKKFFSREVKFLFSCCDVFALEKLLVL